MPLTYIEIIGWAIIMLELFGQKGRLEKYADFIHTRLSVGADFALSVVRRRGCLVAIVVYVLLMVLAFFLISKGGIYSQLNGFILLFFLSGMEDSNPLSVMFLLMMLLHFSLYCLRLVLQLLVIHPSGVLGAVGVLLALSSSLQKG